MTAIRRSRDMGMTSAHHYLMRRERKRGYCYMHSFFAALLLGCKNNLLPVHRFKWGAQCFLLIYTITQVYSNSFHSSVSDHPVPDLRPSHIEKYTFEIHALPEMKKSCCILMGRRVYTSHLWGLLFHTNTNDVVSCFYFD